MQGEVLGRRYAKALFDLSTNDQTRTATGTMLVGLSGALDRHGALADACFNPQYPAEAKRAVLAEAARRAEAGPLAVSFLDLLLKKNRLRFLLQQDVDKVVELSTEFTVKQMVYLHAPVWFIKYEYKGNAYQLVIDGATGTALKGDIPASKF